MKQGFASRTVTEVKTEPKPYKVTPARTNQYGEALYNNRDKDPDHAGRGFKAPQNANVATHKSGSQRRY